jgi:acetate---CoA ligase (ADP-forming) subunit beta
MTRVGQAYSGMISTIKQKYPDAVIDGVSVRKLAQPGVEIIFGMSKDPQFGPVIMFGLGGILVEVLKDVSFRVVPLSKRDAAEMVREIKGFTLLQGFRGQPPVNLEKLLIKVPDFVEKNPRIKELDLNPLFAHGDSIVAVDARILLEPS